MSQPSQAAIVAWTDWTTANTTSAAGTIGGINVNFSGNLNPSAQTSGGTNFWAVNSSIYTAPPIVNNPPPDSDIIRLTGGSGTGTQTLTFSTPVVNPVMAILSLGGSGSPTTYNFSADFDILNSGSGFFGGGILSELPESILEGREGNGLIQFNGTFSSISWTIPTGEFWHGFTVGVPDTIPPTPEPSALLSFLVIAGLGLSRKNRV